jgi:hypothetical protein
MNKESVQIAVEKARALKKESYMNPTHDITYMDYIRDISILYEKAIKLQADRIKELYSQCEFLDKLVNINNDEFDKRGEKIKQLKKENKKLKNENKALQLITADYKKIKEDKNGKRN